MLNATTLFRPTLSSTVPPGIQAPPGPTEDLDTTVRPNVDWWVVNDKKYDSTADMLKNFKPAAEATPAEYHWRQETSYSWKAAALSGAKYGTLVGAGLGAGLWAFLGVAGGAFNILTLGMLGPASAAPPLLAMVGIGAIAGALMGGLGNPSDQKYAFEEGHIVGGKLAAEPASDGNHVSFYLGGEATGKVDIEKYARTAQPGPIPTDKPTPWWQAEGYVPING